MYGAFELEVPMSQCSNNKVKYPQYIVNLRNAKARLWKQRFTPGGLARYRKAAEKWSRAIASSSRNVQNKVLQSGNTSTFYKFVNARKKDRTGVSPLNDGAGNLVVTDSGKSELLNNQFASVFVEDDGNLPTISKRCTNNNNLRSVNITVERVYKILSKLPVKYSHTPDIIPSALLKLLASELSEPLTTIFNVSLCTGMLPSLWKCADIAPLFKKGEPTIPENYRPISLTSCVCKVFERLIVEDLTAYLHNNNLLSENQFGFLANRSTVTQLLSCMYDWMRAYDARANTDVIYVDYAKAFDTVCHKKLLHKLESGYGINGTLLCWLKAFLTDRRQCVKVGNSYSDYVSVQSSVPQGSVLGPILFLLYVNDAPDICPAQVSMRLFADDIKLYFPYNHSYDRAIMQETLTKLSQWSDKWQLSISTSKCNVLCLGNNENAPYKISDVQLPTVSSCKDLGVIIDSSLKFGEHITQIVKKAYTVINLLFRIFSIANESAYIQGYIAYVRPVLEYASNVWNPCISLGFIDKLEDVQRYFTRRLFYRCRPNLHMSYTDRLKYLKLESLEGRRLKSDLILAYQIIRGHSHLSNTGMFDFSDLQRGNLYRLKIQYCRTTLYKNCFHNRVAPIWNSLPSTVTNQPSISSFRNTLGKHDLSEFCKFDRNL